MNECFIPGMLIELEILGKKLEGLIAKALAEIGVCVRSRGIFPPACS